MRATNYTKYMIAVSALVAWPLAAQPMPRVEPGPEPMFFDVTGGVPASYLGVSIAEIDAGRAKALKLPEERGVEVTRVEQGSPAEKAGLKSGDVVLEYNREPVEGMEQFGRMVRETPTGRTVTLKISRGGAIQSLTATIGERSRFAHPDGEGTPFVVPRFEMPQMEMPQLEMPGEMPNMFEAPPALRSGMLGIETEGLTSQLGEYFGVKQGVLIRSVMSGSAAEKAGIRAGDVIVRVDDADVSTPGQVSAAVHAARARHTVRLRIIRNHRELTIAAALEDDHAGAGSGRRVRVVTESPEK